MEILYYVFEKKINERFSFKTINERVIIVD